MYKGNREKFVVQKHSKCIMSFDLQKISLKGTFLPSNKVVKKDYYSISSFVIHCPSPFHTSTRVKEALSGVVYILS